MQTMDDVEAVLDAAPETGSAAIRQVTFEPYGRFLLLDRIGQGGMADIYRAVAQRSEGFRRTFVVKRIRPEKSSSSEFIRMFCEEARISAMLNHPNIVQVYDFGSIGGSYFLAMEYLPGRDLSSTMRRLRARSLAMEPALAAFIAGQVGHGLDHAHGQKDASGALIGVVHRDVTPSNIMLLSEGGVKILDFGIAVGGYSPHREKTREGMVRGKLSYLSPEQVRCEKVDGRADIFALGIVLWEMLTGTRLFAAMSEFETMRNVLELPVPPPSTMKAAVPPALDRIVAKALMRDRQLRYQTAGEMASDLEAFLEAAPFSSRAVPKLLSELFGGTGHDPLPEPPEGAFPAGEIVSSSSPSALAGSASESAISSARPQAGEKRLAALAELPVLKHLPRTARNTIPVLAAAAKRSVKPMRTAALLGAVCAVVATLSLSWRAHQRAETEAVRGQTTAAAAFAMTSSSPPAATTTTTHPITAEPIELPARPPATPPPPRRDVRLVITSAPPGASVQTPDGHVLGRTPLSLPWPAGETPIKLTLDKDGYLPRELMPVPTRDQKVKVVLVADR
jgi:serine/threonine protein kinase